MGVENSRGAADQQGAEPAMTSCAGGESASSTAKAPERMERPASEKAPKILPPIVKGFMSAEKGEGTGFRDVKIDRKPLPVVATGFMAAEQAPLNTGFRPSGQPQTGINNSPPKKDDGGLIALREAETDQSESEAEPPPPPTDSGGPIDLMAQLGLDEEGDLETVQEVEWKRQFTPDVPSGALGTVAEHSVPSDSRQGRRESETSLASNEQSESDSGIEPPSAGDQEESQGQGFTFSAGQGAFDFDKFKASLEAAPTDSMNARADEFQKRREARKAGRLKKRAPPPKIGRPVSTLDTHGFLSALPECHADIAYRFCFTVLGFVNKKVVEAACNTENVDKSLPTSPSKKSDEGYRCFCHVLPGATGRDGAKFHSNRPDGQFGPAMFNSDVPKLCKMIFNPVQDWEVPVCRTRMEALPSAIVCVLVTDPREGEPSFHEQLLQYEKVVDQIHFVKKPLRPARAVLLCRHASNAEEEPPPPSGHLPWQKRLEEHEACLDDNLWKFGPVCLKDDASIHEQFATIAIQRIVRGQESQGEDSDGSQQSDAPPCYEAEHDSDNPPEIAEDEEPVWMTHLNVETDSESEDGRYDSAPMPGTGPTLAVYGRYSRGNRASWLSPMQRGAA